MHFSKQVDTILLGTQRRMRLVTTEGAKANQHMHYHYFFIGYIAQCMSLPVEEIDTVVHFLLCHLYALCDIFRASSHYDSRFFLYCTLDDVLHCAGKSQITSDQQAVQGLYSLSVKRLVGDL